MNKTYEMGVQDAIEVILDRGKRIGGAVNPKNTVKEITEKLLNETSSSNT